MQIRKLTKTDGFLAIDLPDARLAAGPTRLAPKILQDGAELLARSITYSFACYGLQLSGGSAGINANAEGRDDAVAGYIEEIAPLVESGSWRTWPGTGVIAVDLEGLPAAAAVDGTGNGTETGTGTSRIDDPELTAAGAIASAGDLDGHSVGLCGSGPVIDAARAALSSLAGGAATLAEGDLDVVCDTLFVSGRAGIIDHERSAALIAKRIVPLSSVPVTTKAYAVLRRAEITYVPDFVALAAPLLAGLDAGGGDPVARVRELSAALSSEGPGMWLAACGVAEAFLQTWQDPLPFGRPLA